MVAFRESQNCSCEPGGYLRDVLPRVQRNKIDKITKKIAVCSAEVAGTWALKMRELREFRAGIPHFFSISAPVPAPALREMREQVPKKCRNFRVRKFHVTCLIPTLPLNQQSQD